MEATLWQCARASYQNSKNLSRGILKRGEVITLLYSNIVAKCKEKGISIAKLERECDFGNGRIRNWDRYKPSLGSLSKVSNVLNCTIEDLLKGDSKQ